MKFIKHQFFKIQSAAVRIGNGKTHYFRTAEEIRDYIEEALIENPDLVLVAQQAFFDGGIVRYHFGLEFKYCIDLPSLSRAVWPNAMFHNLNAALNWAAAQDSSQSFEAISIPDVLLSFLAMLIVYVLNVMDVRRRNRKTALPPPLPPI